MKEIHKYILEKLHLDKDIKVNENPIEQAIYEITDNFFKSNGINYSSYIYNNEKHNKLQLNIEFHSIYKERLVDGWCDRLCKLFERNLKGWEWCSRSTKFDNPKQSMIVIVLRPY